MDTIHSLRATFYDIDYTIRANHQKNIIGIRQWFSEQQSFKNLKEIEKKQLPPFLPETVIIYELLSIHELIEELNQVHTLEQKRGKKKRNSAHQITQNDEATSSSK